MRAVLHVDRSGRRDAWATHLTFYDQKGEARMDMASWDNGASAINQWAPGRSRGILVATPKNETAVISLRTEGQSQIKLFCEPKGKGAQVDVLTTQGVLGARLGVRGAKQTSNLVLYDSAGKSQVNLRRSKR